MNYWYNGGREKKLGITDGVDALEKVESEVKSAKDGLVRGKDEVVRKAEEAVGRK